MRRQMDKEQGDNMRHELDHDFDALRSLLYAPDPSSLEAVAPTLALPASANGEATMDYDKHVRELAFDTRAKPKDRTKTEEERALEQKEALEQAEKQRRSRMLGLDPDEHGDEDAVGRRKKRPRGGDDLDADVVEDEPPGQLGVGLGSAASGSDEGQDSDGGDEAHMDQGSDVDGFGEDEPSSSDDASDVEEEDTTETRPTRKTRASLTAEKELPYTFPAPEDHDDFLDIIQGLPDADVPIVVQRIRTRYHHSLGPDNKLKLQVGSAWLVPVSRP